MANNASFNHMTPNELIIDNDVKHNAENDHPTTMTKTVSTNNSNNTNESVNNNLNTHPNDDETNTLNANENSKPNENNNSSNSSSSSSNTVGTQHLRHCHTHQHAHDSEQDRHETDAIQQQNYLQLIGEQATNLIVSSVVSVNEVNGFNAYGNQMESNSSNISHSVSNTYFPSKNPTDHTVFFYKIKIFNFQSTKSNFDVKKCYLMLFRFKLNGKFSILTNFALNLY